MTGTPGNPLLQSAGLPAFTRIRATDAEPALDCVLAENRAALERIRKQGENPGWERLMQPLEELQDRLNRTWSPIRHLHAVADSDALRDAHNKCIAKLTRYETELAQDRALYEACRQLAQGPDYPGLEPARRKIIDNALREFRLAGIHLDPAARDRYGAIQERLSLLQTRFDENLLDATQDWTRPVTDPAQLAGLPASAVTQAAAAARAAGLDGWLLTLQQPSYLPVMEYASDRELRREMYHAYVTRASDQGPGAGRYDNSAIMLEILKLRAELAQLLGFDDFAGYSLARKMADSPAQLLEFLGDLAGRSRPVAQRELEQLAHYARNQCGIDHLEAWDIAYCSEQYRRHLFQFSEEELRPYFPVDRVVAGMFTIAARLFGCSFTARQGIDVWHPDVRYYEVHDSGGGLRGGLYLDLFARRQKQGGAWMDECAGRRRHAAGVQHPVAFLTCNFTPPVDGAPSLLTHREVQTLFHEFGHGLHHLLTLVDYPSIAGINGVPWDAVELPSQFLENWCWQREAVDLIAGHHRSGAALPDALFEKLWRARNFQAGLRMVRQLEFALFDLHLHHGQPIHGIEDIQSLLDNIRQRVAVVIPPAYNRFQNSFAHVFAGGYAAGYYSYLWAEVLSADAFSSFEEHGIFDERTGRRFLHSILEQGGARDPMDSFVEFRGRKPDIGALLRHSGIQDPDVEQP